jgi:hypothetical protein
MDNPAITQIDLSKNIEIDRVYCGWCSIYELDLSKNTKIKYIICVDNLLADLDLSNNTQLISLHCENNQIDSLSLVNNPFLEELNCESNILEQLDISANTELNFLKCSDNLLNHLNLKNGNNTKITTLDCTSNPDLTCVLVDDAAYSETNWASYFDAGITFSLDCNPIPEDETIANTSFNSGDTTCYGAYQTITVGDIAENPVDFNVGSSTSLIAGSLISFLPGVHIYEGAYLSATITTDSSFCDVVEASGSPMMASKADEKSELVDPVQPQPLIELLMKVFPNPSSGRITVELTGISDCTQVTVYNSQGALVATKKAHSGLTTFDFANLKAGIYIVKTMGGKNPLVQKIIIQY